MAKRSTNVVALVKYITGLQKQVAGIQLKIDKAVATAGTAIQMMASGAARSAGPIPAPATKTRGRRKGSKMSAAARKMMSQAAKKRWAAKKKAAVKPVVEK